MKVQYEIMKAGRRLRLVEEREFLILSKTDVLIVDLLEYELRRGDVICTARDAKITVRDLHILSIYLKRMGRFTTLTDITTALDYPLSSSSLRNIKSRLTRGMGPILHSVGLEFEAARDSVLGDPPIYRVKSTGDASCIIVNRF